MEGGGRMEEREEEALKIAVDYCIFLRKLSSTRETSGRHELAVETEPDEHMSVCLSRTTHHWSQSATTQTSPEREMTVLSGSW